MTTSLHGRTLGGALTVAALALGAAAPVALGAWAQPVPSDSPLNVTPSLDAVDVQVASVAGIPYAAWREADGSNTEVRVARLTPAGWERVGSAANPASPINQDSLGTAKSVAIADVNGVPYVAWAERDGVNDEIRVARLAADGNSWEKVGVGINPASPVNVSPTRNASDPSVTGIGGVPYVAWTESDGTNTEVRVARLNAAGTGWDRVGEAIDPASPINRSAARDARTASIAGVGGVPYVAWTEDDGTNAEVRVAHLNAAGTGWEYAGQTLRPGSPVNDLPNRDAHGPVIADWNGTPVVAWSEDVAGAGTQVRVSRLSSGGLGWEKLGRTLRPTSPVNQSPDRSATAPGLAVVDGRPWVAWAEGDGTNREVRVARLNAAGTGWEQPVGGISPVNVSAGRDADRPSLASVGGVPYVGWAETDGANREARVKWLAPDVLQLSAAAAEESLDFEARMRSYGLPYPVGFQLSGPNLSRETAPGPLSGDPAIARAGARNLLSGATYQWRTYAVMGANGLRAVGPTQVITTTAIARLAVAPVFAARTPKAYRFRAGARMGVAFRLNLRARVAITIRRDGRTVGHTAKLGLAGRNAVRLRAPRVPGVYTIRFAATASGGRTDVSGARLVVLPRR